MASEVQTSTGRCPAHGSVEATREIPPLQFPYAVYAARRALARRRPFVCPSCGAPVETD
jgi:hypothetical protein